MSKLPSVSDSLDGVTANTGRCEGCGATAQVGGGFCVNCLLREGLAAKGEGSTEVFESVLAEANVPDQQWRLGNYEILEEIGRGGMGVIYRARQRHSRRIVAVKRVLAHQADSHEALVRFRREAEAAAKLDHPNILPIYEVSESEDGLPFFSMKYATGGSLRGAAPAFRDQPNECVRLMAKVARAIEHAHGQGILHRDLQPGNILLDSRGEPMVSDFGLAKWLTEESDLTQTLTTFGTPGYIAPEQAEGAAAVLTPAAAVFSLDAILFNLLANRPPFVGANVLSVIRQAAANPAPKVRSLVPSLGRDLETICSRALERDPKARYQTAGDFAEDLERWLEGRSILARPVRTPVKLWRWSRRNPILAGASLGCLSLGMSVIWLLLRGQVAAPAELPPPEKSIAVLPFEDISDNKENSDFAAGIHDDILTSLAQIHDLKVISRTSVMAYHKGDGRKMRAIGRELGVANILEGSVRREGNRALVNVQLIDARNDRHLWAERYDRTLADSIGLQGELATQIAATLKTTLAPEETARFAAKPTVNSEAYVLYLTALGKEGTDWMAAEQLYVQATAIDPQFALAYARASVLNSWDSAPGGDRERKAKARAQAVEALRLSPSLGEAHMALGLCLYLAEKNYDAALNEFELAAATSPNNAKIYHYVAGIYRRQGRWREAVASYERALSLDPRNASIANFAGNNHLYVRDWAAAAACYTRAQEIDPDYVISRIGLARLEVFRNANPAVGMRILENIPARLDSDGEVALTRWDMAMLERDYAAAEKILNELPVETFRTRDVPKTYYQGRTALARGDKESAQRYFAATTPALEKWLRDAPEDSWRHALVGLLYAYLRRNEDAIREARRAVELEPESQDAFHGAAIAAHLAMVYALIGDQNPAITLVERLLSTPGPFPGWSDSPSDITLADLRLRWEWDSLRSNPRFQKILAEPEPRTNLTSIASAAPAPPKKSIAVLPFENLSDDKENTYFAAGIQDDVLTSLAQIHELKVISRTSVMAYQNPGGRNMREIAQALDVANVLEGSVRHVGNRVLVNVQLIDARNDHHLWAERYDRTIVDSIGLQGELATQIAAALKATLAPEEKARLGIEPTANSEAYVLYLTAVGREKDDWIAAEQLYVQATTVDPKFALAYARASLLNSGIISSSGGYPERKAKARAQAEEALRLAPTLGEAHMALGLCLFWADKKYDAALKEFEVAAAASPNNAEIYTCVGGIYRRQGRWSEAMASYDRALSLDPRNHHIVGLAANNHLHMRDWPAASAGYTHALEIKPDAVYPKLGLAYLEVYRNGNPAAGRKILVGPDSGSIVALARWDLAMLERDYAGAEKILSDIPDEGFSYDEKCPRTFFQGQTALARGDVGSAQRYFAAAATIMEGWIRDNPDDAERHALLGLVYAYLQKKEDAVREGRRAVEIEPESQNAFHGAEMAAYLALVYAVIGEQDQAITLIEHLLSIPGLAAMPPGPENMTLADLRLRWEWDSLRSNPRFQKILAEPEPKTNLDRSGTVLSR